MRARDGIAAAILVATVGLFPGCSSSTSGSGQTSAARQNFLDHCKAATDLACQKGFDCNNFFVTSNYNSVAHCQSEVAYNYEQSATNFTDAQYDSCANTCDLMKADVQQLTCDKFTEAVFSQYHCG